MGLMELIWLLLYSQMLNNANTSSPKLPSFLSNLNSFVYKIPSF